MQYPDVHASQLVATWNNNPLMCCSCLVVSVCRLNIVIDHVEMENLQPI